MASIICPIRSSFSYIGLGGGGVDLYRVGRFRITASSVASLLAGMELTFNALLYNPSILVLDEATSSVDTESEQLIQHAIDTLIKGRTAIIIAHRLSTIRKADKIIVLDKGEVKESGSHLELLAKGGFYAKLHEMQFEKHAVKS